MAHYTPNVWTDNVTPVNKAHMDVIEQGITEAADLYYLGDWTAGTYKEGDIVVYNGVAYVAVRQTTQTPVPWAAGQASLSYGTSLPSNPVDGQEAVLVDSVTAPSYQWRFRYNAGSSNTAKWECVGGMFALVQTNPGVGGLTGGWTAPAGTATFTAPRTGVYQIEAWAEILNGSTPQVCYAEAGIGSGGGARLGVTAAASATVATGARGYYSANASDVFKVFVLVNSAGAATLNITQLRVMPIRVS